MLTLRASLRRSLRTLARLPAAKPIGARALSQATDFLSENELRERLKKAVALSNRSELLKLHDQLPADLRRQFEKKTSDSPPIRTVEDVTRNIELKTAKVNPYGTGCYATRDFAAGEVVTTVRGVVNDKADFESIQIDEGKHLHMERPEVFMNHSCSPNGYIDFKTFEYRTLQPVKQGEQLTWNYNTSEYELQRSFRCQCGARVAGFKFLSGDEQRKLSPYLSPFIRKRLQQLNTGANSGRAAHAAA